MNTMEDLQKEVRVLTDITQHLSSVIGRYNCYFQTKLEAVIPHWRKSNPDHYCFIPSSNVSTIVRSLMYARQYLQSQRHSDKKLKFLDCGCGIGNILMLADAVGLTATGMEYESDTYKLGKNICNRDSCRSINIIKGNILSFRHYKDYDIVYYFTPIRNVEMQKRFVRKLMKDIKVGTVIIPYSNDNAWRESSQFRRINSGEVLYCYEKTGRIK